MNSNSAIKTKSAERLRPGDYILLFAIPAIAVMAVAMFMQSPASGSSSVTPRHADLTLGLNLSIPHITVSPGGFTALALVMAIFGISGVRIMLVDDYSRDFGKFCLVVATIASTILALSLD